MAAEAVYKIKETEEKGKEVVRQANEEAKRILAAARETSAGKKKELLDQALREKAAIVQSAVDKANKTCEGIAAKGAEERDNILAPDSSKVERAIQLVMERIVSV